MTETDILKLELIKARAQADHLLNILVRIHGLLIPADLQAQDGRIFRYKDPEPEKLLRYLAERIRKIPEEILQEQAQRLAKLGRNAHLNRP